MDFSKMDYSECCYKLMNDRIKQRKSNDEIDTKPVCDNCYCCLDFVSRGVAGYTTDKVFVWSTYKCPKCKKEYRFKGDW